MVGRTCARTTHLADRLGGISNFFSQLIVSFGYTEEQSLLYGTPGGAVEVVSLLICGYLGDRYGNRILVSTVSKIFHLRPL